MSNVLGYSQPIGYILQFEGEFSLQLGRPSFAFFHFLDFCRHYFQQAEFGWSAQNPGAAGLVFFLTFCFFRKISKCCQLMNPLFPKFFTKLSRHSTTRPFKKSATFTNGQHFV
jgi:hypothetical protein